MSEQHGDSKADIISLTRSDSGSSCQSMGLQHGGMPELLIGLAYNDVTGRLSVQVIKGSNFKNMAMTRAPGQSFVMLRRINSPIPGFCFCLFRRRTKRLRCFNTSQLNWWNNTLTYYTYEGIASNFIVFFLCNQRSTDCFADLHAFCFQRQSRILPLSPEGT